MSSTGNSCGHCKIEKQNTSFFVCMLAVLEENAPLALWWTGKRNLDFRVHGKDILIILQKFDTQLASILSLLSSSPQATLACFQSRLLHTKKVSRYWTSISVPFAKPHDLLTKVDSAKLRARASPATLFWHSRCSSSGTLSATIPAPARR